MSVQLKLAHVSLVFKFEAFINSSYVYGVYIDGQRLFVAVTGVKLPIKEGIMLGEKRFFDNSKQWGLYLSYGSAYSALVLSGVERISHDGTIYIGLGHFNGVLNMSNFAYRLFLNHFEVNTHICVGVS
jgi:hypothetical protein